MYIAFTTKITKPTVEKKKQSRKGTGEKKR